MKINYIVCLLILLTSNFLLSNILEENKIKAIIFDMGGVLVQLDGNLWKDNLKKMGIDFSEGFQDKEIQKVVTAYGAGKITTKEFLSLIPRGFDSTFDKFESIWNSLIVSISDDAIKYIKNLRKKGYRIYLLSDTNEIHMKFIEELYKRVYFNEIFYELFDECYISFLTNNLKSVGDEAWLQIIREQGFKPEECLFIDDLLENVNKAKNLGFNIFHYSVGSKMSDVFPNIRI